MNIYKHQFYTYLYRDIDDTPIYVGKGKDKRAYSHFKDSVKSRIGNTLKARKRVGYTIEPEITYHQDENTAFAMEIFWIAVYGRLNLQLGTLFNLTDGGDGSSGVKYTIEQNLANSIRQKGRPSPLKGIKTGISITRGIPKTGNSAKGTKNPNKGRLGKSSLRKGKKYGNNNMLILICPHCNKSGSGGNMTRYHFDNCKLKPLTPIL